MKKNKKYLKESKIFEGKQKHLKESKTILNECWHVRAIVLNKKVNFEKNLTELKMEHPTHNFREKNLVFQLI